MIKGSYGEFDRYWLKATIRAIYASEMSNLVIWLHLSLNLV